MYIGEFSKKFGVSADTIRYYINIGLLLPKKINNKYYFQDDCINVMKEILLYKNLNFALDEINELLNVRNAFLSINQSNQKHILDFLADKQVHIKEEINKLEASYGILEEKIEQIKQLNLTERNPMGIPISFLNYLSCPQCDEALYLIEDTQSKFIYNGDLKCHCGYSVSVKEGIINTQPMVKQDNHSNTIDSIQQNLCEYYKKHFNSKTINQLHIFTNQHLLENIKNKKIIINLGIGPGRILKNIINHLEQDCYYIIIDDNYHYLKYMKQNIDYIKPANNIIFIYGDMKRIPLKHKIAHLIIDLFKTDSMALYNYNRDIHIWKNYLCNNGTFLTYFCALELNSKTAWILQKKLKKNFILENIRKDFKDNGFIDLKSKYIGSLSLDSINIKAVEKELNNKLHPTDLIHVYCDLYKLSEP